MASSQIPGLSLISNQATSHPIPLAAVKQPSSPTPSRRAKQGSPSSRSIDELFESSHPTLSINESTSQSSCQAGDSTRPIRTHEEPRLQKISPRRSISPSEPYSPRNPLLPLSYSRPINTNSSSIVQDEPSLLIGRESTILAQSKATLPSPTFSRPIESSPVSEEPESGEPGSLSPKLTPEKICCTPPDSETHQERQSLTSLQTRTLTPSASPPISVAKKASMMPDAVIDESVSMTEDDGGGQMKNGSDAGSDHHGVNSSEVAAVESVDESQDSHAVDPDLESSGEENESHSSEVEGAGSDAESEESSDSDENDVLSDEDHFDKQYKQCFNSRAEARAAEREIKSIKAACYRALAGRPDMATATPVRSNGPSQCGSDHDDESEREKPNQGLIAKQLATPTSHLHADAIMFDPEAASTPEPQTPTRSTRNVKIAAASLGSLSDFDEHSESEDEVEKPKKRIQANIRVRIAKRPNPDLDSDSESEGEVAPKKKARVVRAAGVGGAERVQCAFVIPSKDMRCKNMFISKAGHLYCHIASHKADLAAEDSDADN